MRATLLVIGASTNQHFIEAQGEYERRLRHYISFDMQVLSEPRNTRSLTEDQQRTAEGHEIAKAVQSDDYVVLLDEHGKELRSMEFAQWLQNRMNTGIKRLVFVVGEPYGFSQQIHDSANEKLSLSRMTFSHQMTRLIFTEQLYRAMTILRGEPYHHE